MKKVYEVGDIFLSDGKYRKVLEVTPLGYNTEIADEPKKKRGKAKDETPETETSEAEALAEETPETEEVERVE